MCRDHAKYLGAGVSFCNHEVGGSHFVGLIYIFIHSKFIFGGL